MADNDQVRNGSGTLITAATDELSDGAKSPKVTLLSGQSGSPTPISPATSLFEDFEYETVAASQTNQVLGGAGAVGDYLSHLVVVPATTSPGAITIADGSSSPDVQITVFTGGATSVTNLVTFTIALGMNSAVGGWRVTTGSNVSVIAVGSFT